MLVAQPILGKGYHATQKAMYQPPDLIFRSNYYGVVRFWTDIKLTNLKDI